MGDERFSNSTQQEACKKGPAKRELWPRYLQGEAVGQPLRGSGEGGGGTALPGPNAGTADTTWG